MKRKVLSVFLGVAMITKMLIGCSSTDEGDELSRHPLKLTKYI